MMKGNREVPGVCSKFAELSRAKISGECRRVERMVTGWEQAKLIRVSESHLGFRPRSQAIQASLRPAHLRLSQPLQSLGTP
jgi:hypothetical protein